MKRCHFIKSILKHDLDEQSHCQSVEDFIVKYHTAKITWLAIAGQAYAGIITVFEWEE